MASIKDVAELAGVSIATVSRCINFPDQVKQGTRDKVNEAILSTAYSPNTLARNFRRGKTNIIMVVLPTIGDPFFTDVMKGIQTVADQKNYSLLIKETQLNTMTGDDFSNMLVTREADGIILLASVSPFGNEIISAKSKRSLPIVIGCEPVAPELEHLPSVHIDNLAAAREATNHLIALGHSRIAFIYGSHDSLLTRDRELGYRAAMQDAGLTIVEDRVVAGHMSIADAVLATRNLLNHAPPPTAIFCANDEMAIAAMHECKSFGLLVPQDISIVGFDDIRYAQIVDPPLTTVAQPAQQIGERTMQRICDAIESEDVPEAAPAIVRHQLIVRSSTAAPRD